MSRERQVNLSRLRPMPLLVTLVVWPRRLFAFIGLQPAELPAHRECIG